MLLVGSLTVFDQPIQSWCPRRAILLLLESSADLQAPEIPGAHTWGSYRAATGTIDGFDINPSYLGAEGHTAGMGRMMLALPRNLHQ